MKTPIKLPHDAGGSLPRVVSWHRATIVTESGDKLPAWILKDGKRTVLTAVAPSYQIEPVEPMDRERIATLIANATS